MQRIGVSFTDTSGNITGSRLDVPRGKDPIVIANEWAHSYCLPPRSLRVDGKEVALIPCRFWPGPVSGQNVPRQ